MASGTLQPSALLLDRIVPASEVMEDFEVEQSFPRIGRRTMLLNARKVVTEGSGPNDPARL